LVVFSSSDTICIKFTETENAILRKRQSVFPTFREEDFSGLGPHLAVCLLPETIENAKSKTAAVLNMTRGSKNRPIAQPDFDSLFHTDRRDPLDYRTRVGPNFHHDLLYLRSYIHDARLRYGRIRLLGKKLTIPLERDRWERYKDMGENLEAIASQLTISPVLSISLELSGSSGTKRGFPRPSDVIWLTDMYLGELHWDISEKSEVVLANQHGGFKLRILVPKYFTIRLQDSQKQNNRAKS
jgi:hypothetical protein